MNQLLEQLTRNNWTTLASLPRNDVEMARAALRGGAGGLKVHINVEHFASGTRFGPLQEERDAIAAIVDAARGVGANVGVVPGTLAGFASPEDFASLAAIGVDYFDAYPFDCPAWALEQTDLSVMIAAHHGMAPTALHLYERLGMTLCEASIMAHDGYGAALSAQDLAAYCALCEATTAAVILPSQKKLTPTDLPLLRKTGARGVLLGAIVLGRDTEGIEAAVRAFTQAE